MSPKHKISIIYVFVEQAPGAQGIAQFYKTPVCLAPDSFPPTPCGHLPLIDFVFCLAPLSFPPLVATCLWLILDCSQKVPLVNDANKRHSLALLISPVCPHCLLNNRSYFLQMTISMYSTLEDDRTISRLGNESFIISTTFILFCAIPAFLEARQLDNVQKSRRHINPGSATYD